MIEADRWDLDDTIPERLPLVDAVVAHWAGNSAPLGDATAVLLQHQTGSIVAMVRALIDLGLAPDRCYFIDIPYSAHPLVSRALRELGIPDANFAPSDYGLDRPLAEYQRRRAQSVIEKVLRGSSSADRVLVLDDGAWVLEALSHVDRSGRRLCAVEQTVFGIRKLRELDAVRRVADTMPVINVAESGPKKTLEAEFLGVAIAHALARSPSGVLARMQSGRTLLLGYGAIGASVARALCAQFNVEPSRLSVADPDLEACQRARTAGFDVWVKDRDERRFDVVIGCSGRSAFSPEDAPILQDGAILASASSGAVEFSRERLLALAEDAARPEVYVRDGAAVESRSIHADIPVRLWGRDALLLNGGFPVDFDGQVNCVPISLIQLTRALMVGAAIQATWTLEPGVTELDLMFCEWIEGQFTTALQDDPSTAP